MWSRFTYGEVTLFRKKINEIAIGPDQPKVEVYVYVHRTFNILDSIET